VIGTNIEIFGTIGAVGAVAPIEKDGAGRALLYAGGRGDIGLQGEQVGGGVGARYWEYRADKDLGGAGFDIFLLAELRRSRASHTVLRLTYGVGDDTFDAGTRNNDLTL